MTRLRPRTIGGAVTGAILSLLSAPALGEPLMDLHDIAVGMDASQLPAAGYRDLACGGRPLATWSDWASCPAGGDGLRAVHAAYDQPGGATNVAGHPVDLTVYFGGSGRLAKIEIRTDDHAPPYFHKKAYVLARQAKAHYGEEGWTCKSAPASQDREPIGPLYMDEACTKLSADRHIETSAHLFRKKGASPRDFVSDATITISMAPTGAR